MNSQSIHQAVILAGGKGTRLSSINRGKSKILVDVNGKTLLEDLVIQLIEADIEKILILINSENIDILEKVKLLSKRYKVDFFCLQEQTPLGTGGSLLNAKSQGLLDDYFLVLHGDLLIRTNLEEFIKDFCLSNFEGSIMVHPSSHISDSDLVELDGSFKVKSFHVKPRVTNPLIRNLGNIGVMILSREVLSQVKLNPFDLDRELIPSLLKSGVSLKAFRNMGFIKDIGTPERLLFVNSLLREDRDFSTRPALFIDRDGTINIHKGYITHHDQVEVYPDAARLIAEANRSLMWVFVITNQPVLARGETTIEQLNKVHHKIDQDLSKYGAHIDEYFYCPHHPDKGFPGEIVDLKKLCNCRKPKTGLVERAIQAFPIDLRNSIVVGDSWRDKELAINLGIKSHIVDRQNLGTKSLLLPKLRDILCH